MLEFQILYIFCVYSAMSNAQIQLPNCQKSRNKHHSNSFFMVPPVAVMSVLILLQYLMNKVTEKLYLNGQ